MSKQYAHLHAMAKLSVKFQNDWPKTVGGVALTSQLLMNGQTDKQTGHGMPISHLRANAGPTKIYKSIVDVRTNGRVMARLYRTCVLTQVRQKYPF